MKRNKMMTALALSLFVAAVPAMAKSGKGKQGTKHNDELSQQFGRFDANSDGVISRSEFPMDPALFDQLDRNRDGVIAQSEAREAFNRHRNDDRNGDGVISRSEWNGDLATFDRLDRNRDGVLSQADRGSTKGGKGSRRFHGMDRNRDGMITRGEWSGNDQSFRQHDRNGDGILSGRELRSGKKN